MKRGFFIPAEIWENKDLTIQEKIILAEIASFSKNGKECYISNARVAEILGLQIRQGENIFYGMVEKGIVKTTRFDGKNRFVEVVEGWQSNAKQTRNVVRGRLAINNHQASQSNAKKGRNTVRHTISTNTAYSPILESTKKKINDDASDFVPPSIEMVLEYVKPLGMKDPEGFARYYVESQTANGWTRRDRNKMVPVKDWKNNVRQWIPNHMNHTFPKPVPAQAPAPVTKSEERIFTKADLTTGVLPADMPREMRQYLAFGGTAKFANDTWIKI